MRYFEATTPDYILYHSDQEPDYCVDYCVVAAKNKREARIKAYKYWIKDHKNYFHDCCARSHPPFKHIELLELTEQKVKPFKGSYYYVE